MSDIPNQPRIFVQIASYRDSECQWTVKDLFEKASYPDRIFVGICWQFIPFEDDHLFEVVTRPEQVRIISFDAHESMGACWARAQAQTLWQGEEFYLQIDSHMRFEQGWDELLLEQYVMCEYPKAIISTYPPAYTPPNDLQNPAYTAVLLADKFYEDQIVTKKGHSLFQDQVPNKPMKGAFISAGFCFGPSLMIKEVPYDPYVYFIGEEISLAVRLWTHGWNIYHPTKVILYHYYIDSERTGRKTHFGDNSYWVDLNVLSYKRVKHILGTEISDDPTVLKDLDKYGLGNERSLADYQRFSGVDFKAKTIQEKQPLSFDDSFLDPLHDIEIED